jgi:hypothetical protein
MDLHLYGYGGGFVVVMASWWWHDGLLVLCYLLIDYIANLIVRRQSGDTAIILYIGMLTLV